MEREREREEKISVREKMRSRSLPQAAYTYSITDRRPHSYRLHGGLLLLLSLFSVSCCCLCIWTWQWGFVAPTHRSGSRLTPRSSGRESSLTFPAVRVGDRSNSTLDLYIIPEITLCYYTRNRGPKVDKVRFVEQLRELHSPSKVSLSIATTQSLFFTT